MYVLTYRAVTLERWAMHINRVSFFQIPGGIMKTNKFFSPRRAALGLLVVVLVGMAGLLSASPTEANGLSDEPTPVPTYGPVFQELREQLMADINCDGQINILDFGTIQHLFGRCHHDCGGELFCPSRCPGDINDDGEVNILDVVRFQRYFGQSTGVPIGCWKNMGDFYYGP